MAKYHINPETGNPGVCNAKVKCRFGDLEADHYTSKEAAREAFEARMDELASPDKLFEERASAIQAKLSRPSTMDYDAIAMELKWVNEWPKPWTDAEKLNLGAVEKIADLTTKEDFTPEDQAEAERLISSLAPIETRLGSNRIGRLSGRDTTPNPIFARDRQLHSLARNILTRRLADDETFEPVTEELSNDRLIGLREAQDAFFKNFNHPDYYHNGETYMGDVEGHYQEAIARVVRGDDATDLVNDEGGRSLLPASSRVFNAMHPENFSTNLGKQQLYLAAAFPVNELKEEMDRVGIDGVSVSTLDNGREQGNVYTVVTPDGSTRSFAVYEHRNSDTIIINGKEDWDGTGLPYAGDNSRHFYAQYHEGEFKRAAQALTFYMALAQKGELEDDNYLVANATKVDETAILDAQIPGFKEWRQSRISDRYIAAEDENEEDILKRLDF